ncbi:Abi-alpha family protein [Bradyrhizobium sp. URHD0069]|uniref:Abi-alpha family protein n=1 Tax=Bradyrhizobium sp. URHD0069 TaxID=1380355 RepID=UPI00068F4958|nr:Abi-alpha family protein [Bradyrhizobium sp. URHD0069]
MNINLGDIVPKELLNKVYDDALSGSAKQVGKLSEDTIKTARLLLAPLQVGAALQERFERMMERISRRVPDERRIEPPAEIVGPTLEMIRYVSDDGPLWGMFEEVLTKSIDQDGHEKIHPSFPRLIAQLSRDEAWMLYRLRDRDFKVVDSLDLDRAANKFSNRVVKSNELPSQELYQAAQVELYFAHLSALGLVEWPVENQVPIMTGGVQAGITRHSTMRLTEFGKLFVAACTPPDGFERFAKK